MRLKSVKEFRKYTVDGSKVIRATTSTGETETDNTVDPKYIEGVAAVFNQPSKLLAELDNGQLVTFYEVLLPGAFDQVLKAPDLDCIYNIDHKNSKMIARTKSGTLQLSVDEYGLNFKALINKTTTCQNLVEHIKLKNYSENSFCFTVDEDQEEWTAEDENGIRTRYIKSISGLYDVSTVVVPAYYNTSVSLRGMEILKKTVDNNKQTEVKEVELPTVEPEPINELDSIDLELLLLKNN